MTSKDFEFEQISNDSDTNQSKNAPQSKSNSIDLQNMNLLMDIPVTVSVELGRTKIKIEELLKLGAGSVVELNRLIGEPLDIFVNDKLVARGEAMVSNDRLSIRLTQVLHNETVEEVFFNKSTSAA